LLVAWIKAILELSHHFDQLKAEIVHYSWFPELKHNTPDCRENEDYGRYDRENQLFKWETEVKANLVHVEKAMGGWRHGERNPMLSQVRKLDEYSGLPRGAVD
jgi:hypothetical protein